MAYGESLSAAEVLRLSCNNQMKLFQYVENEMVGKHKVREDFILNVPTQGLLQVEDLVSEHLELNLL